MRVEKLTTPERKRELDKISSIAFTYPMRDPDPKEQTATNAEEQQRNIEEFAMVDETNDKLMGGMILLDYQTRIGDKWLPLTGIGGVATLPEYRRAGVIRGIFKHILPRMYENGIAISGLYPFAHAFYRKFGYEVTSGISTASVGLDQLRAFPMPDEVRQIDNQRDELLARGVYEKFAEKRDISMRREISAYWKWLLSADIYKERAYRYLLMRKAGDAMEPCAYISFTPDNQPDVATPRDEALRKLGEYVMPRDMVSRVSCKKRWMSRVPNHKYDVVAVDCGIKYNIIRLLNRVGCNVTVMPYNSTVEEIMAFHPDGLVLSNGPGNPEDVTPVIELVKQLRGRLPIFGICMGHQLISLAYGARTFKMKFGHRGANHPVKNLVTGKLEITSQNHSYAVDVDSLAGTGLTLTHVNLLDGTAEGVECAADRVFSMQYHPESASGPQDSAYLFKKFTKIMEEHKNA